MNIQRQNRKPSIWRPVKAQSFGISEGVNLIKAPTHARGYESPRGSVRVLSKNEIDPSLKVPGHTRAATRVQQIVADHVTNARTRRVVRKIGFLGCALAILTLLFMALESYVTEVNMSSDFFSGRISSQAGQIRRSLRMNNIKRTITDTSLEFFRMTE